jgi:putative transposase
VELWLSILVRKLLRRGNFTSTEDLRNRVLDFVAYFNRTMARLTGVADDR